MLRHQFYLHFSNILPTTLYSYEYSDSRESNYGLNAGIQRTKTTVSETLHVAIEFHASGIIAEYSEEFSDIGAAVVFFFALLDPIRLVVNHIFVKWYNNNSRDLYIANKLFYMENVEKKEKYDFESGAAVFLTCLLYRHALMYVFKWAISLFGYNMADVLPKKCIHTMAMINKGESLLFENNFFGALEELSSLEDCPAKKIPFFLPPEDEENE